MANQRVIIADTDLGYLIPLQYHFLKTFGDEIELEIITDADYFRTLFSSPQRVTVLAVSEGLYDPSLHRHSIGKLFLLTEQYDDGTTEDPNAERIYKYTSIREVFNDIVGRSGLQSGSVDRNEPKILLVFSPCGGTGKTTVALGISTCLARNYKKVLYINASRLQTFQRLLENETPIFGYDIYNRLAQPDARIYQDIKHILRSEVFSYLPPFRSALVNLGLPYSIYCDIAVSAKESRDYDYIVVDADHTFDEDAVKLMSAADKVLVVTRQNRSAVSATKALASNMEGAGDKYVFVCNDFNSMAENALILSDGTMNFTVNEYISHFPNYDHLRPADFAADGGMQRAAYLMM